MQTVKINALKGICKRHYKKCMSRHKFSFSPRTILALTLERFCENENEDYVQLLDGWWEFLKQKCVASTYDGMGVLTGKFKCLSCKEYFE